MKMKKSLVALCLSAGLLASGDKVIDIALALGYESPSAFTSMFRKQFGLTPSQFFAGGAEA